MNVRAAFWHVVSDFIMSVGVFIASVVLYFNPQWYLIDPIITFVFSIVVVITTFKFMKEVGMVLMEGTYVRV